MKLDFSLYLVSGEMKEENLEALCPIRDILITGFGCLSHF